MAIKVRVVYDGEALQLKEPLDVEPGTELQATIEPLDEPKDADYSFFRLAREIAIDEGPTDWSEKYEEYLYPDPPRSHRDDENRNRFFRAARLANLEGPPDWSAHVDDYLYGDLSLDGFFREKQAEGELPVKPS